MTNNVTFEIAELLREKGFDKKSKLAYQISYPNIKPKQYVGYHNNILTKHKFLAAPTIAEVVMGIYEKYGIWIWVENSMTAFTDNKSHSAYNSLGQFNSPTDGYLAAIEYTLKNLI